MKKVATLIRIDPRVLAALRRLSRTRAAECGARPSMSATVERLVFEAAKKRGRPSVVISAAAARARLFEAVAPFIAATVDRLDPDGRRLAAGIPVTVAGQTFVCRVVALLQYGPAALLRVFLLGLPRAVELERLTVDEVPDLRPALEELLSGALSSLARGHAAEVLAAADVQGSQGGLIAWADPGAGEIRLCVVGAGDDLARAVEFGRFASAASAREH